MPDELYRIRFVDGLLTFDVVFKVDDSIKDNSFNMECSVDTTVQSKAAAGLTFDDIASDIETALTYIKNHAASRSTIKERLFTSTVECNSDMKYMLCERLKLIHKELYRTETLAVWLREENAMWRKQL